EGTTQEGEGSGRACEEGSCSEGREENREEAQGGEEAAGLTVSRPGQNGRATPEKKRPRRLVGGGAGAAWARCEWGVSLRARTLPVRMAPAAVPFSPYFSRAATLLRPSSSFSTRSRPWFARSPSRFILLISVDTNERDAPTRSARSCCVMPCRHSSLPGAIRSPCAWASVISISARRAGTSLRVSPRTRCRICRTRSL